MNTPGGKEWKIPENDQDLREELRILGGAIYNLMKNTPNRGVSVSVHNNLGKSVFITMYDLTDEEPKKIVNEYSVDDGPWKE